jgi:hypothetical protein
MRQIKYNIYSHYFSAKKYYFPLEDLIHINPFLIIIVYSCKEIKDDIMTYSILHDFFNKQRITADFTTVAAAGDEHTTHHRLVVWPGLVICSSGSGSSSSSSGWLLCRPAEAGRATKYLATTTRPQAMIYMI